MSGHRKLKRLNLKSLQRQARAAQAGEEFIQSCTGKKRYASGKEATEAADVRRAIHGGRWSIYKCPADPTHWHLSGHPKSAPKVES